MGKYNEQNFLLNSPSVWLNKAATLDKIYWFIIVITKSETKLKLKFYF